MSLRFKTSGDRTRVWYSLTGTNGRWINGNGSLQEFRGSIEQSGIEGMSDLIRALRGINCAWSIANRFMPEVKVDGLGLGLFKRFQEDPTKSWAKVAYFQREGRDDAAVTISIIMPDAQFEDAWAMFKLVHTTGDFIYNLSVEGHLRSPRATTSNPTVAEFSQSDLLGKRAIISDEIELQFAPRDAWSAA